MDSLLQVLVGLLSSDDLNMLTCATGILSNLTCNNAYNKTLVTQSNGVEALIHAILRAGEKEDVTEPAVCALRHLTSRHQQSELAQNAVRKHYGIPAIVKLLNTPYYWPVIKVEEECYCLQWPSVYAIIQFIKAHFQWNFFICCLPKGCGRPDSKPGPVSREPGSPEGCWCHPSIGQSAAQSPPGCPETWFISTADIPGSWWASMKGLCLFILIYKVSSANPVMQDGVRMEEIVEGCTGALHILARDPINRADIANLQTIPLFVQVMPKDLSILHK